jgi:hypothetical protein
LNEAAKWAQRAEIGIVGSVAGIRVGQAAVAYYQNRDQFYGYAGEALLRIFGVTMAYREGAPKSTNLPDKLDWVDDVGVSKAAKNGGVAQSKLLKVSKVCHWLPWPVPKWVPTPIGNGGSSNLLARLRGVLAVVPRGAEFTGQRRGGMGFTHVLVEFLVGRNVTARRGTKAVLR